MYEPLIYKAEWVTETIVAVKVTKEATTNQAIKVVVVEVVAVAVIIEEEMVEVQTETATKPEDISIQDTMIKMSGIIYPWNRRTKCWKPEAQNEMWDQ